jgi:3-deoxy-D-manno-octulosonate 8-phosphate phosphatase KdsC-like HAD superfamily phosphatase
MQEILEEVKKIRVDIFDIDGMLADGNLYFMVGVVARKSRYSIVMMVTV